MKTFRLLLIILMFTTHTNAQTQIALDKIKPGEKWQQVLRVSDGTHVAEMPVQVIKGAKAGPVFSIVAGVHGYEYAPIMAVQKWMQTIDPAQLSGTLVIVPIANTPGFYGRSIFYNPQDGKNLNRVFPGNANGSISERLAHLITTEIINQSDVFLDIHAGDGSEELVDFVCYYDNKDTPVQTAKARQLCALAGFEYSVSYPFNLRSDQPSEYAFKQSTRQGIVSLSFEAGNLGMVSEASVTRILTGIGNILAELKMYPKPEGNKAVQPKNLNGQTYIKSPQKGIFYSELRAGEQVTKGQHLGYITDVFGKRLEDMLATQSGIILYKIGTPPVLENETVFCIGYMQ